VLVVCWQDGPCSNRSAGTKYREGAQPHKRHSTGSAEVEL
jgi:hypothetical protein